MPEKDRTLFAVIMNVEGLNEAITEYSNGNKDLIMEQHSQVRKLLELLFLEDKEV